MRPGSAFTRSIACSGSPAHSAPDAREPRFNLPIPDADRRWASEVLAGLPRPRIILNLGAQWLTKRWPPEHYAEIGRRGLEDSARGLIAVGSSGDRPLVDALLRRLGSVAVLDLCGRTRLPQLAALSLESDLVISNDTGPLHLAAAAAPRVVGIYTCTSPELTGPFGPRAATVRSGDLVRCQLPQELQPPRLHDRAAPGQGLAGRRPPARGRFHVASCPTHRRLMPLASAFAVSSPPLKQKYSCFFGCTLSHLMSPWAK